VGLVKVSLIVGDLMTARQDLLKKFVGAKCENIN
jgi:hypothetical protein